MISFTVVSVVILPAIMLRLLLRSFSTAALFGPATHGASAAPVAVRQRRIRGVQYGMAGTGLLAVVLTVLVIEWAGLSSFDTFLNQAFVAVRAPAVVHLFYAITLFGTLYGMAFIAALVSGLCWLTGRGVVVLPLWVAFAGAELTTWSMKLLIDRPRPPTLHGIFELSPSFPSSHATATTAVIGYIALLLANGLPSRGLRLEAVFWATLVIVMICLSRLILSLHYASDVLEGALVGGFWAFAGAWLYHRRQLSNG
ncbi:phosphatase PAP2 family protein [Pseudomonas sp. NPDC007930]|uniref:phosphatase PAP2 family protein n=1 Tax=Pseudomonas sp. NPDC007930 TaxID=3364417 RepID=UPI0036EA44D3